MPQYQALVRNDWLQKANAKLDWKTQELQLFYQEQHARVPTTCGIFNKQSEKTPVFEFEEKEEKPDNTPCLTCRNMLSEECNWIDVAMRGGVCNQTCQYALSILEKVKRETLFDAAYNNAFNKLYYYPHNAKIIFDLTMALVNGATKEDVCQMKEAEYIEYTMELAEFDYEDEVKVKSDKYEIEFGEPETTEKIETTPIYLIENQPVLQLKYFNNNGQEIKPEKAHEIDAGYNLRYPDKDTLILKPKSLTKINLKIALKILPRAMVQIAFQFSLASKGINIRGEIIDAGYTGDITVILQNKTDKPFKIKHAKKIVQVIYLPLINISGLQLVNQRELLGKSEKETQVPDFSEIIGHLLPKINPNPSSENYHVGMEKLSRINIGQLEPQQQSQLKELIAEFADIFAKNNNNLGRTNLVQHQIYTEDAKLK
ncbi:hypothetical protein G9A89_016993 [Geosiphon pyriformis]|nr:hypothetical protein G9A89_016993 [Geosiphon pyriformis]